MPNRSRLFAPRVQPPKMTAPSMEEMNKQFVGKVTRATLSEFKLKVGDAAVAPRWQDPADHRVQGDAEIRRVHLTARDACRCHSDPECLRLFAPRSAATINDWSMEAMNKQIMGKVVKATLSEFKLRLGVDPPGSPIRRRVQCG